MTKLIERREKERVAQKDIIILYHANCSDGFGGAWAAWKKFGDTAEYFPVYHMAPPPGGLTNKTIYMIDFVYPEEITKELIKNNKRVTAIDHHVTNENVTKMTQDYLFSLTHSGAGLAWQYFHPDKPLPTLLAYVQEMDLWKFDLPNTEEMFAAIDIYSFSFADWSKLADELEDPEKREQHLEEGRFIKKYDDILIDRLVSKLSQKVIFEGVETYAVNSSSFASEIGARLYTKFPPMAIIWYQRSDFKTIVSLRSDGTKDVAELAAKYGGGGHKTSSGFTLEFHQPLPWEVIK